MLVYTFVYTYLSLFSKTFLNVLYVFPLNPELFIYTYH